MPEAELFFHKGENERGPYIRIDAEKCGMHFKEVARVVDPDTDHPLLQVERPLGFSLIKVIMARVERGLWLDMQRNAS